MDGASTRPAPSCNDDGSAEATVAAQGCSAATRHGCGWSHGCTAAVTLAAVAKALEAKPPYHTPPAPWQRCSPMARDDTQRSHCLRRGSRHSPCQTHATARYELHVQGGACARCCAAGGSGLAHVHTNARARHTRVAQGQEVSRDAHSKEPRA
jgi:hypothetical protein